MARIVSPSRGALAQSRPPLRPGERRALDVFESALDQDWEIYVQPYLNGCRPDFVLLHPRIGVGLFEVKDWDLDPNRYRLQVAADGALEIALREDGMIIPLRSPMRQIMTYRDEVYNLYCPRLKRRSGLDPIASGLVLPFAKGGEALDFLSALPEFEDFKNGGNLIWGAEAIKSENALKIFFQSSRAPTPPMTEDQADDLRAWLIEPDHAVEKRRPLALNAQQNGLASSRTASGFRRIRGPAGSGKSLVLAARAARLAAAGKSVLVVTFNITLTHYLRDLCARHPNGDPNAIVWLHFHGWCKRIAYHMGFLKAYRSVWTRHPSEQALIEMPKAILAQLRSHETADKALYDAILVDEGQDFDPLWWEALRQTLKPGGEMLLVADATQDTYGKARAWTDEVMIGAGFSGRWTELSLSYRMPPSVIDLAAAFAEKFLPPEGRLKPLSPLAQGELDLAPCALRWVQTRRADAPDVCFKELMRFMRADQEKERAMSDLILLTDNIVDGRKVERTLNGVGLRATTTFSDHPSPESFEEDRRKKMAFWKGDGRVKITTLQSFKGWEGRLLVLNLTHARTHESLSAVYAGLTRLKKHAQGSWLTVVCSDDRLREFGRMWPEFEQLGAKA